MRRLRIKNIVKSRMTAREYEIMNILKDFGRFDANALQITFAVNYSKQRKKKYYMKEIKRTLEKMVELGMVERNKYKGGIIHYKLKDEFLYS